jgi:hypothetical protein
MTVTRRFHAVLAAALLSIAWQSLAADVPPGLLRVSAIPDEAPRSRVLHPMASGVCPRVRIPGDVDQSAGFAGGIAFDDMWIERTALIHRGS